jgi:hypothetical protein
VARESTKKCRKEKNMAGEPTNEKVTTPNEEPKVETKPAVDYEKLYKQSEEEKANFKKRIDELCAENKAYKDKEIASMSEAQKAELARQQREEEISRIIKENATFKKQASLIDAGYSKEEVALIMENDSPATFAKIMNDRIVKNTESIKLQNVKDSTINPQNNGTSQEKRFNDYTPQELAELAVKNPTEFNKILKGK